jgi:hypothetical protein
MFAAEVVTAASLSVHAVETAAAVGKAKVNLLVATGLVADRTV